MPRPIPFIGGALLIVPLTLIVPLALIFAGCDPGRAERQTMQKQIEALQKENAALKQTVADLQQKAAGGGGAAANPLAGLSSLFNQLGKGNFKIKTRPPGRGTPMDPDLQKRVDRMVIDGLEKLSKNQDAKALVKEIIRAMKRDLQRQGKAEAPPAKHP